MRERIPAPCEHFDLEVNYYKDTCPDMIALVDGTMPLDQCSYYWNTLTGEEQRVDPHGPCKRRRTAYADTQTVDMFGEKS